MTGRPAGRRARVVPLLLTLLLLLVLSPTRSATPAARASGPVLSYFPLVSYSVAPNPPSVFGAELESYIATEMAPRGREAGIYWSRYNGLLWDKVETRLGAREWGNVQKFEDQIAAISTNGMTPIVVVRSTPAWAQKVPGVACGPIALDYFDAFAAFMTDAVTRYSQPPYNVHHWELWNEPDVDIEVLGNPTSQYGCWGDADDFWFGGAYYGEMLKVVYPAIKAADPDATVIVGGLLLDCDPHHTPCHSGVFLDGILATGAGDALDMVGFHSYAFWSPLDLDWDYWHGAWDHRGGVLLGKVDFIRNRLSAYGHDDKALIMNEGGLLCHPGQAPCPDDDLRATQANYAVRMYVRAWANDLVGAVWYTLNGPGWREGGLLDESQRPRRAYGTLSFFSRKLTGARYTGSVAEGDLERYYFSTDDYDYQVMWRNYPGADEVAIPPGSRLYDMDGAPLAAGPTVAVGFDPLLVETAR